MKFLGQGAFGTVALIKHIKSGRTLVWKEVNMLEGTEERTKEEARLLSNVACPYIASLLDWFVEEGTLYMVMEYYSGGTLQTLHEGLVREGKMIEEKVFLFDLDFAIYFYRI
jgi:serine/threonine protein kinase